MIRIDYKGAVIQCSDAREAQEILRFIANENSRYGTPSNSPWDAKLFWKFVESLGTKQRDILKLLLSESLSDQDLRAALGVTSNQQLAGLLSGLSKQAAGLGIQARAVYKIETEFKGGETKKSYAIAPEFAYAAQENNWGDE
jgi:hypothetical protein